MIACSSRRIMLNVGLLPGSVQGSSQLDSLSGAWRRTGNIHVWDLLCWL